MSESNDRGREPDPYRAVPCRSGTWRRWSRTALIAWGCGLLAGPPASSGVLVDRGTLDAVTWDCDAIKVVVQPQSAPQGSIEVLLETAPDVTWWKGIAWVRNGRDLDSATTTGGRGSSRFTIPTASLQPGDRLDFRKAKVLGIHTGMYELDAHGQFPDASRVWVRWTQDWCINGTFHTTQISGPKWLAPGSQATLDISILNTGSTTFTADAHYELGIGPTNDRRFQVPPRFWPSAVVVAPGQGTYLKLPITAPSQETGRWTITGVMGQAGSTVHPDASQMLATVTHTIEVCAKPGACTPKPPAPVTKTTVPAIVGLAAPDAERALQKAGLAVGAVTHAGMSATPAADRIVVRQDRWLAGARVDSGTSIDFATVDRSLLAPQGYRKAVVFNCSRDMLDLWRWQGGEWSRLTAVAPSWDDAGSCPGRQAQLYEAEFPVAGEAYALAFVDPKLIGCTTGGAQPHPSIEVCRRAIRMFLGDPKNGIDDWFGTN